MTRLSDDLAFRGLIYQVSDDALLKLLDEDHLVAYIGFDPTADSLHIGNLLQLTNLRRLQEAGHQPIVLAGGATGMIGDPGGKTDERQLLTPGEIAANLEGIRPQLERFLDFGPGAGRARALLLDNSDWLGPLPMLEFLRDVGKHFTVNQMIAKDAVRSRIEREGQGISYTEFSYMLLQAEDFAHLFAEFGCRLQMGASDQWGNITAGIELVRKRHGEQAYGLTSPLVLRADGTKFGKSEGDALYLSAERTSAYALYQYLVRSEDALVGQYLRYFTFLSHEQITALDRATAEHPERRAAQQALAHEVVALVHGGDEAARVEAAAAALFSEDLAVLDEETLLMVLEDAPSSTRSRTVLDGEGLDVVDALVEAHLVASKSAARTTVEQGGAYVNNRRVAPGERITRGELIADRYVVLRRGRRDQHLLSFS